MRRPSRLCALGASAILFQPLALHRRGVYRGSEAAVIAARFTMRAASLAGLPPMLLIAAEFDPLVDDCAAFAQRAVAEGGMVEHHVFEGVVHGFFTLGKLFPESGRAVALAAQALRRALRGD